MSLLDKFLGTCNKKDSVENKALVKPVSSIKPTHPKYDFTSPGLSQHVTFGRNRDGEVAAVVLNKPTDDYHKVIVNNKGCFENFPGIIQGKWTSYIEGKYDFDSGKICFRTSFERQENGYRCLWEIQPDGRYWADEDGFGAENDSEIILYADLDEDGDFVTPFRIYKIDGTRVDDPSVTDMDIDSECKLKKYKGSDEVVIVPKGIKKIGLWAFGSNKTVKEICLSDTLTEIEDYAFERSSLERIVIPEKVIKMGYYVFYACEKLQSVTLPAELDEIGSRTFGFCKALKQIVLPRNLKTVNSNAFEYSGIEELSIPEGMVYVGKDSFRYMSSLKTLHLPSTLMSIGESAFSFCAALEEVNFPEGLVRICDFAFEACRSLEKIELPDSLLELAATAFSRTAFSTLEDVKALAARVNETREYPLPAGYKAMDFNGLKLQYSSEEIDFDEMSNGGKRQFDRIKLSYIRDFTDDVSVYQNDKGEKAIMIYFSMPTFDSGDREWDSYRKLYLIPTVDKVEGFLIAGGYKIAKIYYYPDIRWGNEKTKKLMKQTGAFKLE